MSITFQCEHCRKEVKAPDAAAGKRGKCPFCGQSNYIPSPTSGEALPLAPIDDEEERRREEEAHRLLNQEKALLSDRGAEADEPLEHREDLAPEDVHHFVVNYCLDMANSNLQRAPAHVRRLKEFGALGVTAVDEFLKGNVEEPALKAIPERVLRGFLKQLRDQLTR